jgi:hypothetical protein
LFRTSLHAPAHKSGARTAEIAMTTEHSDKSKLTIHDRFEVGNFDVDEVCNLKKRSRSGFYADLKAGVANLQELPVI